MVTGLDLVREQVWIAAGRPLGWTQDDVPSTATRSSAASTPRTPAAGFVPTPGLVTSYREPAGPGRARRLGGRRGHDDLGAVRPDGRQADRLGRDRDLARRRMLRALGEFEMAA